MDDLSSYVLNLWVTGVLLSLATFGHGLLRAWRFTQEEVHRLRTARSMRFDEWPLLIIGIFWALLWRRAPTVFVWIVICGVSIWWLLGTLKRLKAPDLGVRREIVRIEIFRAKIEALVGALFLLALFNFGVKPLSGEGDRFGLQAVPEVLNSLRGGYTDIESLTLFLLGMLVILSIYLAGMFRGLESADRRVLEGELERSHNLTKNALPDSVTFALFVISFVAAEVVNVSPIVAISLMYLLPMVCIDAGGQISSLEKFSDEISVRAMKIGRWKIRIRLVAVVVLITLSVLFSIKSDQSKHCAALEEQKASNLVKESPFFLGRRAEQ